MSFNKLYDYIGKELHQEFIQAKCTTFVEIKKKRTILENTYIRPLILYKPIVESKLRIEISQTQNIEGNSPCTSRT